MTALSDEIAACERSGDAASELWETLKDVSDGTD